jgi:hypothetical protein
LPQNSPQICPNPPLKNQPEHLPIHIQNLSYLCSQTCYSKTPNNWPNFGP